MKYRGKHINNRLGVLKRDKFTCLCCGSKKDLTMDHIIPQSEGGTSHFKNLQTLCKTCNNIKGNYYMNFRTGDMTNGKLPTMEELKVIKKLEGRRAQNG